MPAVLVEMGFITNPVDASLMSSEPDLFALGIAVGVLGIAMVSVNYFIYRAILAKRKRKYGGRVLELSDELLHR